MKIRDLFVKPIDRPINGVIKADQRDAESIWQELEEYVITNQLTEYFRKFFDAYLAAADNPNDPVLAARMGVWVSGFFGSGKSHFIKILSYLLENIEAVDPATGLSRRAADFFDEKKISDPMLLGDVHRAIKGTADVILFNIDAKADSKSDRDVILQVFLRVFNEKLGYSGDSPHIAELERFLVSKNAYDSFQSEFHRIYGSTWRAERDAVDFLRDEVVESLAVALKMTPASAAAWFDNARDGYKINIESFAKLLREYLDTQPAGHRIIFLVDEVGQFIGANTQLMLTLQTITEQLGTLCQGRAWVIVTSQEDMDAAIGDANKARSQDFSKIQGRFHTRLSLASSNTDEVIGKRLLAKTEDAHHVLRTVYERQADIIKNQLSFVGTTVNLRSYKDAAEFVSYYPFVPYQFTLLQKVFESIRRVGATGQHLSRGERSLLDAFQSATRANADRGIDALVPLHAFYLSIESFLDTTVKRAIDQAAENSALDLPGDLNLLKALFLIRYVAEVIKPTVENLATLCLEQIDADKLALKRRIQASLERLESQALVSRSGEQWFFLTNEERDVAREISRVDIASAEKTRFFSELVFDDILGSQTRVRHKDTKADYDFNRLLDGIPFKQASHQLAFEVITPLADDYDKLSEDKCILRSADGDGRALIRLDEASRLDVELSLYLQIEKFVDGPKASTATPSLKKIMAERKEENRERRLRLVGQIGTLMAGGTFYAKGQKLSSKASNPGTLLDELVNYLVTNTFHKLQLLKHRCADHLSEIRALLTSDDMAQQSLALGGEEGNPQAIADVREYLNLVAKEKRVLLSDVVDRYTTIPYGWKPDWEVVLIITRLFMAGEIKLTFEGTDLEAKSAFDPLSKPARFKQVAILKRKLADAGSLKRSHGLFKDLFASLPREDEDGLVADWRKQLDEWTKALQGYLPLAGQKHHPGKSTIDTLLARIAKQQAIRDAFEYVEALNRDKSEWLDAGDDKADLCAFYDQQLSTWRKLLEALTTFEANRDALVKNPAAATALKELEAIRDNPAPFPLIKRIDPTVAAVQSVNDALAGDKREFALNSIDNKIAEVQQALTQAGATSELSNRVLLPLQTLKTKIAALSSIPQILYLQNQGGDRLDEAMEAIGAAVRASASAAAAATAAAARAASQTASSPTAGPASAPLTTQDGKAGASTAVAVPPPPATNPEATAPKPSQTVHAAHFSPKTYLESETEVEAYLATLKAKLMAVLADGQRIRIQ